MRDEMSERRRRMAANAGLFLTMFFWGSMIPVIHVLFATWDAPALNAIRYTVAVPLVLIPVFLIERGALRMRGLPWWRIWVIGGLGIAGFNTFHTLGIAFCGPITAAVIGPCAPVLAALMASAFFRIPLARGTGLALVLAVGGGLLAVIGTPGGGGERTTIIGVVFLLTSYACWSWYSLAGQRWLGGLSQLTFTAYTMAAAATWFIAIDVAAVGSGWAEVPTWQPSGLAVALMAWLAVTGSAMGVFFWNYGVHQLGVVIASMYLNLCPVFAVLISMAFGAHPTAWQLIGGALVLAGVIQAQVRRIRA